MTSKRCMRRLVTCGLVLCGLCLRAQGVGYDDFPDNLQQILDERIDTLNSQGGVCLAGRVTLSDGAAIRSGADVMVNSYVYGDMPIWVYEGGWFIMDHRSGSSGPDIPVFVRAFGYDPIDTSAYVLRGAVTYLEYELVKTPRENLASVTGIVRDENDQPFNGAILNLYFPFASHGFRAEGYTYPNMHVKTGPDGQFRFSGLSTTEHRLIASASEYAYHADTFAAPAGEETTQDRKLYPNRRIIIDYMYQPDGSRDFDDGTVVRTIDWLNDAGGMDFSQNRIEKQSDANDRRDLEMVQDQDVLKFRVVYLTGRNGFYDAGVVDFDSLTEAAPSGYVHTEKLCQVGHVYVVHTYDDAYAKFIVRTDEWSFRTVVPGDSPPMHLAGYGLTIDFLDCADYGKVYVRKDLDMAAGLQMACLPYCYEITGLDEQVFVADILFAYDRDDVQTIGLSEQSLAVYRSRDAGANWQKLETQADFGSHTLQVQGIDAFGLFVIAGQYQGHSNEEIAFSE